MYHDFDYKKYINNTWQIDCKEMILTKNNNSSSDVYSGPGYIRKNIEGVIEFKMYSNKNPSMSKLIPRNTKAGQMIPKEEYFTLKAIDIEGLEWFADYILPSCSGFVSSSNIIIVGEIWFPLQMSWETNRDYFTGNQIIFVFDEEYDVLCNRVFNAETEEDKSHHLYGRHGTELAFGDLKLFLYNENSCTVYTITSSKSFTKYDEYRCLESLQYVLSRPLEWVIMEKESLGKHEVQMKSISRRLKADEYYPPCGEYFRGNDTWKLFNSYLSYIMNYHGKTNWHPISIFHHRLLVTSKAYYETRALEISVAIEGLLQSEYENICKPSEKFLRLLDELNIHITNLETEENHKDRIIKALDMMKKNSAADIMRTLVDKKVIEGREYATWKKLRNKLAHPKEPAILDSQELLDLNDICITLFHKLIFYKIKYSGKYIDYGIHGWPSKDFVYNE